LTVCTIYVIDNYRYNLGYEADKRGNLDMLGFLFFVSASFLMYILIDHLGILLVGMVTLLLAITVVEQQINRIIKEIRSLKQK